MPCLRRSHTPPLYASLLSCSLAALLCRDRTSRCPSAIMRRNKGQPQEFAAWTRKGWPTPTTRSSNRRNAVPRAQKRCAQGNPTRSLCDQTSFPPRLRIVVSQGGRQGGQTAKRSRPGPQLPESMFVSQTSVVFSHVCSSSDHGLVDSASLLRACCVRVSVSGSRPSAVSGVGCAALPCLGLCGSSEVVW